MVGNATHVGGLELRNILSTKSEGKRLLGRNELRWKHVRRLVGGVDCTCVAEYRDQWWSCLWTFGFHKRREC